MIISIRLCDLDDEPLEGLALLELLAETFGLEGVTTAGFGLFELVAAAADFKRDFVLVLGTNTSCVFAPSL